MTMPHLLGDEYPCQQERMRTLYSEYESIGPAGAFGRMMLQDLMRRADKAVIEQDTVAMIRILQEMKAAQ